MARENVILKMARELKPVLVAHRRDFHMHPELSFEETRTAARVAEVLGELDIATRTGVGRTGVVGLLRGKPGGRTIALRADMDALPLQEANRCAYRSRVDGVMHACGHDAHTAMLLGAATILSKLRARLKGNVKFLFQPAEEIISGAPAMIADGCLARPKVQEIMGVHIKPDAPCGTVGLLAGPNMAASSHFRIVVHGVGAHGGYPQNAKDPLVAANHLYGALTTIRRNVDAFKNFVLSICAMQGGTTYNIIPDDVTLHGTLRTYDMDTFKRIRRRIARIMKGTDAAFDVTCRIQYGKRCPVVVNDEGTVESVRRAAAELGLKTASTNQVMGAEDFAYYLQTTPGAFIRVGACIGKTPRIGHGSTFDIDEHCLPVGAALMAQWALKAAAKKK